MRRNLVFVFLVLAFILNSCIYKEFRFNNANLKDDWQLNVISPVFYGNWNLYDLLSGKANSAQGSPFITFETETGATFNISESILFEPTVVIDSFNFYIDGDDYVKSAALVFEVDNQTQLDFYLRLRFFDKLKTSDPGFVAQPSVFFAKQTTSDTLFLSKQQIDVFKDADRVQFSTFFGIAENGISGSVKTNSEIRFSVLFIGKLNREYD